MAGEKRLIDANALIDWLTRHTGFRGNCEDCTDIDCLDCIIENAVKKAPTVDAVEVVHGEWVHHYYDSGEPIDDKWYCSECHMCNDHRRTWYCPNCGAKMDGDLK